jgi:hypothetical protein
MIRSKLDAIFKDSLHWGVSLFVHALVFLVLAVFTVDSGRKPQLVAVLSELRELGPEEAFQDELTPDQELRLDAPVTVSPSGGSIAGAQMANPIQTVQQTLAAAHTVSNRNLVRPLTGGVGNLNLDSNISGLKGVNEMVGAGGDAGVLDRITQEILRQLDKNKVIVAWVFDASKSLEKRRENIAQRFDRIYTEFKELGVADSGGLLTVVASVGQETRFVLDKPSSDVEAIRKAIRAIKEDASGKENLFAAVRETALKYRRIQTATRRTLIIVLLTDEIGDDTAQADQTLDVLKRNNVPLYIMGPIASFSRPTIYDYMKIDGFDFWVEIKRGPYTREEEFMRLMYDGRAYKSGFGTFALTQIARETGGIYFIYDDDRVPGPKSFDMNILLRYKANYGTAADYQKEIGTSPLRRTLFEIAQEGNKLWYDWPGWLHAFSWRSELPDRANRLAQYVAFAEKSIPRLEALESQYRSETDQRWRANFDLAYARLLLSKVRSEEYAWACADFKANPRILKDPKTKNSWVFTFNREELQLGRKPGEAATTAAEPKEKAKSNKPEVNRLDLARKQIEKARTLFRRLIDEHSGTPWADAAQTEIRHHGGGDWVETYDPNFADDDPARRKALEEARKKVPKR